MDAQTREFRMSKKEDFIDWLAQGVKYSLISENKAYNLFISKYKKVSKERFAEIIYEEV
jgi:hypothetical protein